MSNWKVEVEVHGQERQDLVHSFVASSFTQAAATAATAVNTLCNTKMWCAKPHRHAFDKHHQQANKYANKLKQLSNNTCTVNETVP